METKPLLYGLIGFFIGGLVVSLAATTFDKSSTNTMPHSLSALKEKKGDDFDRAFIDEMIAHHQGAIDMSMLSAANAKHDEIKQMSIEIISAQEKEINQMKKWNAQWGYTKSVEHGHRPQ